VSVQSTVPVVAFHVAATGHATNVSNRKGLNTLPESAACGRARSGCENRDVDGWSDGGRRRVVLTGYTSPVDGLVSSGIDEGSPGRMIGPAGSEEAAGWEGSILNGSPERQCNQFGAGARGTIRSGQRRASRTRDQTLSDKLGAVDQELGSALAVWPHVAWHGMANQESSEQSRESDDVK
jgi:hypothetical protein